MTRSSSLRETALTPSGSILFELGRGRSGKTTTLSWIIDRAYQAERQLLIVDGDRNNATLSSTFPQAIRPPTATDAAMTETLENVTAQVAEFGGNAVIDVGGGDRLITSFAQNRELFRTLKSFNVRTVVSYFSAGGRDDLEIVPLMAAMGLRADHTIIYFNEGLAPASSDPFGAIEAGKTVTAEVERGAVIVRIPAVPLATMAMVERLYLTARTASEGAVPMDKEGNPAEGAQPLGFWRRLELKRWLAQMEERHQAAGVAGWLP